MACPNVRRENLVVFGTPRFYYLEHDQSTDDPLQCLMKAIDLCALSVLLAVSLVEGRECPNCHSTSTAMVEELADSNRWLCRLCGKKWRQPEAKVAGRSTLWWIRLAAAACLAAFVSFGPLLYDAADKGGWFPHRRTLNVWMSDDWLVGEFKTCFLTSDTLKFADGSKDVSVSLTCGSHDAPLHKMSVEFRGPLDSFKEDMKSSWWNCQRKEDSITCKAK